MKPSGPIPPDFRAIRGELAIAGRPASEILAEAGETPLFVYAGTIIRARVSALRAAMPAGVAIHYAIKANPHADVLALLAELVDGFDVVDRIKDVRTTRIGMHQDVPETDVVIERAEIVE